jgi:endonuclease/exonuclease/phosphatase (EEP) superfamily protein YafD
MARHGFASAVAGSPITHDLRMRLDWVFARGLAGRQWAVYPMRFSDHHALWVDLS